MGSYAVRDVSIAKTIDKLESDLRQLKSIQKMGYDTTTVKQSVIDTNPYDLAIPPGGFEYRYFLFTADRQDNVQGVFRWQVGMGNISNTALGSDFAFGYQDLTKHVNNSKQFLYGMNITNLNLSQTMYIKTYAFATDTGAVSMTVSDPTL